MAKWGGAQKNAGRKKGSLGQRTQEIIAAVAKSGISPLEYMLKVMRDPEQEDARRDEMAKAAAPFIHPKLNAISAPDGGPVQVGLTVTFVAK